MTALFGSGVWTEFEFVEDIVEEVQYVAGGC